MWKLGTWFCGDPVNAELMVELDDLRVLSNLNFSMILSLLSIGFFCSPQPCTRLCKSNINIELWGARESDGSRVWCSDNHPKSL